FALPLRLGRRLDRRVRVRERGEVRRARPRAELGEEAVRPLVRASLRDPALRVLDVAEDYRLRRAGLLAGRDDLAVADRPVFLLRRDPGAVDALDAVAALLHDPAAAHRDVGVAQELQAFGRECLVEIEG